MVLINSLGIETLTWKFQGIILWSVFVRNRRRVSKNFHFLGNKTWRLSKEEFYSKFTKKYPRARVKVFPSKMFSRFFFILTTLLVGVKSSSLVVTCPTPSITLLQGQVSGQNCHLSWSGCSVGTSYAISLSPLPTAIKHSLSPGTVTPSTSTVTMRVNATSDAVSGNYNLNLQLVGSGCGTVSLPQLSLSIYCSSPVGCASCLNSSICISCAPGFFMNADGITCSQCPANTYSAVGSSFCSPCANNSFSPPGSSFCIVQCATYLNVPTNCQSCPAGSTLLSDRSDDCPGVAGLLSMYQTGLGNYEQRPTGIGAVQELSPKYFSPWGMPLDAEVQLEQMKCTAGSALSSYFYPGDGGVFYQILPSLATGGNEYTISAWMNIGVGSSQLSWSTMTFPEEKPYIWYSVIPAVNSPLTCLFTPLNITCHLYKSDVVIPPFPTSQNVHFALTERNIANTTGTCDNWGIYFDGELQTPISCTPVTRPVIPESQYVAFSFLPNPQILWNGIVSNLLFGARVLTPNELYAISSCETISPLSLCSQADNLCVVS